MKTKYSKFQLILEIIGAMILITLFIYLVKNWSNIPEKIPGHYNALGAVDRWGKKVEIITLPIIGGILYLGLTILTFFPEIWNVTPTKTEETKKAVYSGAKTMVIVLKVELISIFFYLTFYTANSWRLPIMFTPIILIIIFGTLIYFTVSSFHLSKQ